MLHISVTDSLHRSCCLGNQKEKNQSKKIYTDRWNLKVLNVHMKRLLYHIGLHPLAVLGATLIDVLAR